jgi:ferric iron reductase protein FhuF
MAWELVDGARAAALVTDAVGRVTSLVSYLGAEVGDLGPYAPTGAIPADGAWVRCRELVDDPAWLEAVIGSTGHQLGTDDPVVAASLFVQNYAYRVLTLAVACLTTSGVIPDSSASSMSVALRNGRASTVGYSAPSAFVIDIEASEIATRLEGSDATAEAFGFVIARAVEDHLAPLIDSTRARIRVGSRLLWGNVAASAAVAFRTMEGCLGPWVQPLGERFFECVPVELVGLGSFFALEAAGRRGWYWERTNCCLYDRLPGNIRCGDCSRTPVDERRASYLASLTNP